MKRFITILSCIFVLACWQEQDPPDDTDTEISDTGEDSCPDTEIDTETDTGVDPPDTDPPG